MSTANTNEGGAISAEPGVVLNVSEDLARARESSGQVRDTLGREERLLAGLTDPRAAAEQSRRVEQARLDLDAAEAFEDALADGSV